jgi:hypothetical protein
LQHGTGWDGNGAKLAKKELHGGLGRNAGLHVPKDHDKRHRLAGGEGLGQAGEAELRVGPHGGADARRAGPGGYVYADVVFFGPLCECLVEDGLVEGVWVAEEGVLTAVFSA